MHNYKLILLLGIIMLPILAAPRVYASPITVTVTPGSQVVSEYSTATFAVGLSAPAPGILPTDQYSLVLTGLSYGSAGFSSPVIALSGALTGSTNLVIDATTLCPGTYSLQVTATHSGGPTYPGTPDSGTSVPFTLTVTPVGPPLQATVTTDKSAYRLNDKVTIQMSVNKPAIARLTILPPGGSPKVFGSFTLYGSTSKTLTADTVGRWSVTLECAVCSEYSSSVAYFDVSPDTYDVTITINGVPSDVSVGLKVDGTPQGAMGGTEIRKLTFKVDTQHVITLDPTVAGAAGVQYFSAQNTWSVTSTGSREFDYVTQYQLTVVTDPNGVAQVTGGGWFNAGTVVQTSQAPDSLTGDPGTKYAFKGWKIDGVLQSGNPISVTMDKPHTAVATYETQYQLIVDSAYGNPQGSGYYTSGSAATFSVTAPVGVIIQQVLTGWDGDFTGSSSTGSITMDKPHRVHANWVTSYFQAELLGAVVAAIVVVLLLLRRRRAAGPAMKKLLPSEAEAGAQPESDADTTGEMASVKCSSCSADVPAGEKFCENCGNAMT